MVAITIPVCDVCQDRNRSTRKYHIQQGERVSDPDLCEEHGAEVEKLLSEATTADLTALQGSQAPVVRTRASKRTAAKKATAKKTAPSRRREILTPEEIEQRKAAGTI